MLHKPFCRYVLLISFLFFCFTLKTYSQKTAEDLGAYIFNAFHKDSVENLIKVVPTREELGTLAEQIGLSKDSPQYKLAFDNYQHDLDQFREKINTLYADTLGLELSWANTTLDKLKIVEDSIHLNYYDPNSKAVAVSGMKIYFSCKGRKFVFVIDDVFKMGDTWKLGNNIYVRRLGK